MSLHLIIEMSFFHTFHYRIQGRPVLVTGVKSACHFIRRRPDSGHWGPQYVCNVNSVSEATTARVMGTARLCTAIVTE